MFCSTGTSYEIKAASGAGGMGQVFRATDTKLRRAVAVKVLPDDLARDKQRLEFSPGFCTAEYLDSTVSGYYGQLLRSTIPNRNGDT